MKLINKREKEMNEFLNLKKMQLIKKLISDVIEKEVEFDFNKSILKIKLKQVKLKRRKKN